MSDRYGGEALDRGAPVAGEIRIADRGYATAQTWHRFRAAGGADTDFIVRLRWNTVSLLDEAGQPFDLIGWLKSLPADPGFHERQVQVAGPGRRTGPRGGRQACQGPHARAAPCGSEPPALEPLALRLVAQPKPPEATAATLKHLRRQASRKQHTLDPRSEVAAGFVVLATSLPGPAYPAEEVLAAYRLRWQIEIAFKRLKSLLHIDRLRTRTDAGTRCWLHTHLIMALLCDDQSQDLLDIFPSGPR